MSDAQIMVVEDDPDIMAVITYNLRREQMTVLEVASGDAALVALERQPVDLVILDLMLPGTGGLEICTWIRNHPRLRTLPVLMVTARNEETDIIVGLGMGADDYLGKPFRPRELVARTKALLRRSAERRPARHCLARGALTIDLDTRRAFVGGSPVDLTTTEYRILLLLAEHPERICTRHEILLAVGGDHAVVEPRTVDVHILNLRRKLGVMAGAITTIRGSGYQFIDAGE